MGRIEASLLLLEWRQEMAEARKENEECREEVHLETKQLLFGGHIL